MGHLSVVDHLLRPSWPHRSPDLIERLACEVVEYEVRGEIEVFDLSVIPRVTQHNKRQYKMAQSPPDLLPRTRHGST
jgi:hypothetical protein